jgi:hypothetical protein
MKRDAEAIYRSEASKEMSKVTGGKMKADAPPARTTGAYAETDQTPDAHVAERQAKTSQKYKQ